MVLTKLKLLIRFFEPNPNTLWIEKFSVLNIANGLRCHHYEDDVGYSPYHRDLYFNPFLNVLVKTLGYPWSGRAMTKFQNYEKIRN